MHTHTPTHTHTHAHSPYLVFMTAPPVPKTPPGTEAGPQSTLIDGIYIWRIYSDSVNNSGFATWQLEISALGEMRQLSRQDSVFLGLKWVLKKEPSSRGMWSPETGYMLGCDPRHGRVLVNVRCHCAGRVCPPHSPQTSPVENNNTRRD